MFFFTGGILGPPPYVRFMMDKKLDTLEDEVGRITEVLGAERQALWTVLRASTLHKLEYWLGTVHPSLMTGAASRMDRLLLRLLECSTGATIPQAAPPRLQGAGEWPGFETIIDIPVDGLRGKSFQWWVSQIPIWVVWVCGSKLLFLPCLTLVLWRNVCPPLLTLTCRISMQRGSPTLGNGLCWLRVEASWEQNLPWPGTL